MTIKRIYCPYCGGSIKFDIDSGNKHCFCLHCGRKIILDDEDVYTNNYGETYGNTRNRNADIKDQIRLKELEADASNSKQKLIKYIITFVVGSLYVLGFVFIAVIPYLNGGFSSQLLLISTLYLTAGIFAFDSDKFKDRKKRNRKE